MVRPTKDDESEEVASGLRAIEGVLPERLDRRRFLETAVTGTMLGIAGCTGGGGDGEQLQGGNGSGGNGGGGGNSGGGSSGGSNNSSGGQSSLLGNEMPFRLPVEPGPNYVTAYAANYEGFWKDAGIVPPVPEGGNGSGDTAKRIATNVNHVGHSAVTPQVAGLARQNFNILQFGTAKARTQAGLIHRKDAISDPYSPEAIRGANVAAADGLDKQMWQLYLDGIGAENIEISYIDTSAAATLLQKGKIDAIWDSINDFAELQEQLDAELGFGSMYNVHPLAGYYLIVNSNWYNNNNMTDWTRRLMEGYSAAGHWALTNREAAMDILTNQVPELKTLGTDRLLRALAAGVAATNLTPGVKKNGFGYLDPEIQKSTFQTISQIIDVETPSADKIRLTDVTEQVELTKFSNSEWSDLQSFAEPFGSLFQDPQNKGTSSTTSQ